MPTYKWDITRLITKDIAPNISNYVIAVKGVLNKSVLAGETVEYTVDVDGEVSQYRITPTQDTSVSVPSTILLTLPEAPDGIIDYADLSYNQVVAWVEGSISAKRRKSLEHLLNAQILNAVNKARLAEMRKGGDKKSSAPPWEWPSADPVQADANAG
jgi:hypothetical protein